MKQNFEVLLLKEAKEFIKTLDTKCQDKILRNIEKAKKQNNPKLLKKLKNTQIWEFRTGHKNMQYRLLAFWDNQTNSLVFCSHGFIKKSQRTPKKEIEKAENIRNEYLNHKS